MENNEKDYENIYLNKLGFLSKIKKEFTLKFDLKQTK